MIKIKAGILKQNYNIQDISYSLLLIFFLYKNKKINKDSFLSYCKKYRERSLLKSKNLYHCKINNKWYDSEPMIDIYKDISSVISLSFELNLEDCLNYISLLTNKKKNYNVDFYYYNFILPIFKSYYYEELISYYDFSFKLEKIISFEEAKDRRLLAWGYCCEDCDGDYDIACRYDYDYNFKPQDTIDKNLESVKKYLQNLKTKESYRNFNNPLL